MISPEDAIVSVRSVPLDDAHLLALDQAHPLIEPDSGRAPPREPVVVGGCRHRLRGAAEPFARPPIEICENSGAVAANMRVSDLPAHGAQKVFFIAPAR